MFIRDSHASVLAAVSVMIVSAGIALVGQGAAPAQKPIEYVDAPYSQPGSGKQMYQDYCAACHGMLGKGDGPAAKYLSVSLPDLSMLSKAHYGKFPANEFAQTLRLGSPNYEHGTPDMPLWGPLFKSQDPAVTELRIRNLREYVESIQAK